MSDAASLNAALEGRYRIEREIGEGGMATVYLARDERHNRNVALKVLKPELARAVGSERFLHEIRVTAGLQHPHILPLFDSGRADSFLYYVMPYVEGESLRARLDRDHELSVEDAVRIAVQVADALEYAHRHDVVHRDIKPENVLLHDGSALVADFGIALAVEQSSAGRLTDTGLSLGTPQYMSPEQVAGDRELDRRSDLYSLASVTYEMLAGEPPFSASTAQAVVARVLAGTPPPLRSLRATVPPHIERTVAKGLEKLPADRFRTARDFAEALKDPRVAMEATSVEARPNGTPRSAWWHAWALVAAALAVGGALGWALRPVPEPGVRRWGLFFPEGQAPGLRTGGISLLPDGSGIVYAVADTVGDADLYLRRFDELEGRPLAGTDRAWAPGVSPDGRSVSFDEVGTEGGLRILPLDGGPLFTGSDSLNGVHAWGPDGMIYSTHSRNDELARVPAAGGPVEILATRDSIGRHLDPDPLPNGKGVILTLTVTGDVERARVAVWSADSRQVTVLTHGFWARYAHSGHLLFVRPDGVLYAAPFDAGRLELTGPAVPMVEGVAFDPRAVAAYDVSENGTLVYVRGGAGPLHQSVVWVDRAGTEHPTPLEGLAVNFGEPRLAPDGLRLATNLGEDGVWLLDLRSGTPSRVTYELDGWHAGWSPDGREVLFVSDTEPGPAGLYAKPVDGSAPARLLYRADGPDVDEGTLSTDGAYLVMELWNPEEGKGTIVYTGTTGDGALTRTGEGTASEDFPELSPDGRWLAYTAEGPGREEVYVRPFPGPGGAWQISRGGGTAPLWSHGGGELFYVAGDSLLMTARISTEGGFALLDRTPLFSVRGYGFGSDRTIYGVAPDDQRFLFVKNPLVYLGGAVGQAEVIVVENFFEELRRLGG